jgi:hypothetical protein
MRTRLSRGAFLSRKWKVHTWETSLKTFSVPCLAASEGTNKSFISPFPNINTVATQETFQTTMYDWHLVTIIRSCVSLSKWFLMFWINMVPVSSWSSSLILNMKASWSFKRSVLTDQHSTNIPKQWVFSNTNVRTSKSQFTFPLMAVKCWQQKWHNTAHVVTYCCGQGKVRKTDIKHCIAKAFCTLWTIRYFAFQLVLKCCIIMVYCASSHNVNAKINQWPKFIKSTGNSKNLHKASHQQAAEQFHISDNFIYL